MIQTVCGMIEAEQLGICLAHEHLWCDTRVAARPHLYGMFGGPDLILRDQPLMSEELRAYRKWGGQSLVEATCIGWGRDVRVLRELSRLSGVHVVATTGFYVDACLPLYLDRETSQQLADRLSREIEYGVGDTGIQCGLLKAATSISRIQGREEKALKAVACAQRRTGASIITHTPNARNPEMASGNMGQAYLDFLTSEGVAADRLIVGHVDGRPRIDSLIHLAEAGCYLSFDLIGTSHRLHDESRAELISALIGRGLLEQILLSHDVCATSNTSAKGGRGFCHLFDRFLPLLREKGTSDEDISIMLVDNPARAIALR